MRPSITGKTLHRRYRRTGSRDRAAKSRASFKGRNSPLRYMQNRKRRRHVGSFTPSTTRHRPKPDRRSCQPGHIGHREQIIAADDVGTASDAQLSPAAVARSVARRGIGDVRSADDATGLPARNRDVHASLAGASSTRFRLRPSTLASASTGLFAVNQLLTRRSGSHS